ncbi:MAG: hypothetical protein PHI58_02805 [Candidatus Omnitrophica bacterium]|nr:hypothetical protein [Candidatus Omnitrophota bacterium]
MFRRLVCAAGLLLIFTAAVFAQEIYTGKDGNIKNIETRAMVIEDGGAYLATRTALYRIGDIIRGDKWSEVFSLPPGENEINALAGRGKNLFLGTKRGLFRTCDEGKSWRNVFRTIIPEKNNVLSIEISRYDPKRVIICTARGIFLSEDLGGRWDDISANVRNKRITSAALNKDVIYAAGEGGLYSKKPGELVWERIYVNSAVEEGGAGDETPDTDGAGETEPGQVSCVSVKNARVYLGINKRIVYSDDHGAEWKSLPSSGLAGKINYILPSRTSEKMYCATTKGVYEFDDKAGGWKELYKGLDRALSVTGLIFHSEREKYLWAVTENGLYKIEAGRYSGDGYIDVERNLKALKIMFEGEPALRELQKAAIKFCDVSPDKISNWHRDSRLKALVPKVSVGMGNDRSSNTEIYTSATRDYAVQGPEDYSNNLDFSVSWDLGNLIWTNDQTSIDVRSRLNTQLRNDILDDLRRVYYERKRLQFDLITAPPKDMRSRFERELRIQELTQALDDLTGNYMSDNVKHGE